MDLMSGCLGICALPFIFVVVIALLYYITFIIVAFFETVANVVSAIFGKSKRERKE